MATTEETRALRRRPPGRGAPARRRPSLVVVVLSLVLAVAVFLIAFDNASYTLGARATIAIAVWWLVLLGVGLRFLPQGRLPRAALIGAGALAAFAAWTGLSIAWAESAERAFNELNRVTLYLGVFLLVVLAGRARDLRAWIAGIAVGITAIGVLALVSRFFPGPFPTDELPFFGVEEGRLNYPLNYWNGLAALLALALPLLFLFASSAQTHVVLRGLALAPVPALVAAVYLTSSRGASIAGIAGILVFVALTRRALPAALAVVAGAVGGAAAVAVLRSRPALVDQPATEAAIDQGPTAAFTLAAICLVTGLVWALACMVVPGSPKLGAWPRRIATGLGILLLVAGLVAARPGERLETFKQPPAYEQETIDRHLISLSGQGRWQWWESAVDQFRTSPSIGQGAGSFEAWWAENSTVSIFARDAHSLYLETLGELGAIGLLLLLAALGVPIVAGFLRLWGPAADRSAIAALLGASFAYLIEAGVDWMWELTAVSVVAFICFGLLAGKATVPDPADASDAPPGPRRIGTAASVGVAVVAFAVLLAQLMPLLAQASIRQSRDAVGAGDVDRALESALAARELQPWAASPYLQLALVEEELGRLNRAHGWILRAVERDPRDWSLWLVRARIETRQGRVEEARQSVSEARRLNPNSPLFQQT